MCVPVKALSGAAEVGAEVGAGLKGGDGGGGGAAVVVVVVEKGKLRVRPRKSYERRSEAPLRDITLQFQQQAVGKGRKQFVGNRIRTTKYTLITYCPKALFEQYRRVANWYFTLTAALSLGPFSPFSWWTTWTPLVFVIGVSMVKEGYEDFRRSRLDKAVNHRKVDVLVSQGVWERRAWKDVRVGDVVRVLDGNEFPADLLVLSSGHVDGTCWVQTANLDGETNLKSKRALEETLSVVALDASARDASQFNAKVVRLQAEGPNPSLYTFDGVLSTVGVDLPVGPEQVLLRGSTLRNTSYVVGGVVYTGHDTKIMRNQVAAPSKRSHLDKAADGIVWVMFAIMLALSLLTAILLAVRNTDWGPKMWYLQPFRDDSDFDPRKEARTGVYSFLTSITLYSYLIPISLYVSLEIVRVFQSNWFIDYDRYMYDESTQSYAKSRTSNLNEELGMTVLSDKTGTLTENRMEFFKCAIAGVSYGQGLTEVERSIASKEGRLSALSIASTSATPLEEGYNLRDEWLEDGKWLSRADANTIKHFFTVLALCHTAVPKQDTGDDPQYEAESPDEAAFVVAARRAGGLVFVRRGQKSLTLRDRYSTSKGNKEVTYELLATLQFSSVRKRMSVLVRDPAGKIFLMTKGADSVIYERLALGGDISILKATQEHCAQYATAGLRTLVIGYREVSESEYASWQVTYKAAATALSNRKALLEDAAELIEKDLILLGATAIEDKLQAGVPHMIELLHQANIAVWVLTGDKLETAVNIGLLRADMRKFILQSKAVENAGDQDVSINEASSRQLLEAYVKAALLNQAQGVPNALVIDGHALADALQPANRPFLTQLAALCDAVVACRVSPKQKAQVTMLVRKDLKHVTLAVGDGANDAANIGVGISGLEGRQAVMAADFAIGQFRFLERLLLWHGRSNYRRLSRFILYFFYKNVTFGMTLFWHNINTFFSGGVIYVQWYLSTYNLIWTALPICVVAVLDQDVDWPTTRCFPELYIEGQRNEYFTFKEKAWWLINGLWQSAVLYYSVVFLFGHITTLHSGLALGADAAGTALYTAALVVVTVQLATMVQYWPWPLHLVLWGSLAVWIIAITIAPALYGGIFRTALAPTVAFWLFLLLMVPAPAVVDFTLHATRRYLRPKPHHIAQEVMKLPKAQFQQLCHARKARMSFPGNSNFTTNGAADADDWEGTAAPDGPLDGIELVEANGQTHYHQGGHNHAV
eukprot:jgi/Chlat1/3017/Chrsp201S03276